MHTETIAIPYEIFRASRQDGSYPRPQLVREDWVDLGGEWSLRFDDEHVGLTERWYTAEQLVRFDRTVMVPFPPESEASGVHDTGFHPVVWYERDISVAGLTSARALAAGERVLLHFGAVDYRSSVWLNGTLLGHHEGGHTPFSFDITHAISDERGDIQSLVVRAEDDPLDVAQPRGKQDWLVDPHVIWYHRTTGIWQPVWLEAVPAVSIDHLAWSPNVPGGSVRLDVELSRRPDPGTTLTVALRFEGELLAEQRLLLDTNRAEVSIPIPRQINGQHYEELLWSERTPRLIDATITMGLDTVHSYFGLRSAAVEGGHFLLNDRPVFLRSVLNQGYWPESHLAAPSADALRAEVQLIKDLGFNSARMHQKIEDPRFLYWADRLGLLLWEEMPSAYEFSTTAARRIVAEWSDVIRRDSSHPSIITWVPLNESWGVQHIAHDPKVREFARSLFHLTKSLDGSRPVVSNDGWEHLDSDIWSIHDYEPSGTVMSARYADASSVARLFSGMGPAGRRLRLSDEADRGQPVMLTEFGGIKFAPSTHLGDEWGYSSATTSEDFAERLDGLLGAVHASEVLAGYCYTQLTDTGQETNGLLTAWREPKLPIAQIRALMVGTADHGPSPVATGA